jgi:hypothetical protein
MSMLEKAILLAVRAHEGQVDKAGAPYFLHPLRVMLRMGTEEEMIVALLHDVVEDASVSLEDLRRMGYTENVVEAIESVTRRPHEPYEEFVRRAAANPIGWKVKVADLEDNMDLSRLPQPTERDFERLRKYEEALKSLSSTDVLPPSLVEHISTSAIAAQRRRVYGIDFSGAANAGKRIWIAEGAIKAEGLRIERCDQASKFLGSGPKLEPCLAALRDFIAEQKDAAFGLDFPFGLPKELVTEETWEDFIKAFLEKHADPGEFRNACLKETNGKELKRVTDREAKTPFSCYNLRLYKQTYYGIARVLAPLVRENKVRVLPMQIPQADKPWVLEICPASTLKILDLYMRYNYKGTTQKHQTARKGLLRKIERKVAFKLEGDSVREVVIGDPGGDALDSVIASAATFCAVRNSGRLLVGNYDNYAIEGYVYK